MKREEPLRSPHGTPQKPRHPPAAYFGDLRRKIEGGVSNIVFGATDPDYYDEEVLRQARQPITPHPSLQRVMRGEELRDEIIRVAYVEAAKQALNRVGVTDLATRAEVEQRSYNVANFLAKKYPVLEGDEGKPFPVPMGQKDADEIVAKLRGKSDEYFRLHAQFYSKYHQLLNKQKQ